MIRIELAPTATAAGQDVELGPRDLVLIEGPNGAGKTSLLRAVAGLTAAMPPVSTSVDGEAPSSWPAARAATRIRFVQQQPHDGLVGLTLGGEFRLRRLALPAAFPLADRAVATLSSGEARRAALSVCAAQPGDVILLDEPAEGLDAQARETLVASVHSWCAQGACVLVVDHGGLFSAAVEKTRPPFGRVVRIGLGSAPTNFALAPIPPSPRPASAGIMVAAEAWSDPERGVAFPVLALGPGFHVLRGPNGCGKSTWLQHLAGLRFPTGVLIAGKAPDPGRNVRLLLPHARDHLTAPTLGQVLRRTDPTTVSALAVQDLTGRHPATLSGGEAQRAALALAFARDAAVVLLDEPEAHLDARGRQALRDLIASAVARAACVVAATHDPALYALAHTTLELGPTDRPVGDMP